MRSYVNTLTQGTEYIMNEAELRRYRYETIKQYKIKKKVRRARFLKRAFRIAMTSLSAVMITVAIFAFCFMQI